MNNKPYMINIGDTVIVERNDYLDMVFYKIKLTKNGKNGIITGYKNIRFKKDVQLENNTRIKIKDMHEDFYKKDQYNTIFTLFIDDFENLGVDNMADFPNQVDLESLEF